MGEFRRISGNLQSEVREALSDPTDAFTSAVTDVRQELGSFRDGLGGFGISGAVGTPPPAAPRSTAPPSTVPPPPDDPSLN